MSQSTLYFFIVTVFLSTAMIYGLEYRECENGQVGNFIAVASNCSKAIFCNGVDSNIVECDTVNPYFSPTDQMCYDNSSICGERSFIGGNVATTTVSAVTPPTRPATNAGISTTRISAITTTPRPTINVVRSTSPMTTRIPTVTTTPRPTTTASITTTNNGRPITWPPVTSSSSTTRTSSIATTASTTTLTCPSIDDPSRPLFLPHPKFCSQYYLCYHGVATLMQCPNMLHFDVTQQSCNKAEKVNCQVSAVAPHEQCLPHTVDLYPHATNCNYYYMCEHGFLMVMQCPFNMGWDYEKRVCVTKPMAKCYNEALLN